MIATVGLPELKGPEPLMAVGSMIALGVERIVKPVEGMHQALSKPWFAALGAVGQPVRVAHGLVSRVVYQSIRLGAQVVGIGLNRRTDAESSAADSARALVNGLWGDDLGRHEPLLGTSMRLCDASGVPLPAGSDLSSALPSATDRIVVMVHGFIQTERCWQGSDTKAGMINAIEEHPEFTPLVVRYNTGHAVGTNGARLAALLEEVHETWPRPLKSIALVGHSMGGLVITNACAIAAEAGYRWIEAVSDVVTIGSPHRGAPLEKLVDAVARGLGVAPQTRPLADFLNSRSQGIKDLRSGSSGSLPGREPIATAAPPHGRLHFVAGVATADPAHPLGALFGDLVVSPASSTGSSALEPTSVSVVGGVNHFGLLHNPAVIDHVLGWLATPE